MVAGRARWNSLTTHQTVAFFLYFTIMTLGPELLPASCKHLPVSEGLRVRHQRDLLSSASVPNILDQETILGMISRRKCSAALLGSELLSSLHLPGVRHLWVPERQPGTELGVELMAQTCTAVPPAQWCFSRGTAEHCTSPASEDSVEQHSCPGSALDSFFCTPLFILLLAC